MKSCWWWKLLFPHLCLKPSLKIPRVTESVWWWTSFACLFVCFVLRQIKVFEIWDLFLSPLKLCIKSSVKMLKHSNYFSDLYLLCTFSKSVLQWQIAGKNISSSNFACFREETNRARKLLTAGFGQQGSKFNPNILSLKVIDFTCLI